MFPMGGWKMINIHEGRITDLLSNSLRHNPETMAVAYAVLQEKRRILALAERTRLMAAVDSLEERILDYLAVELRTPAYEDSLPLETKRTLIKGTLPFYAKLGTPAAVDWVTNAIFRNGRMREWFEYTGEPHHFMIEIDGTGNIFTVDKFEEYIRAVFSVKRLSSWLDKVVITISFPPTSLHVGGGAGANPVIGIPLEPDDYDFQNSLQIGGGVGAQTGIGMPVEPDHYESQSQVQVGGTAEAQPVIRVPPGEDACDFQSSLNLSGTVEAQPVMRLPPGEDGYSFQSTVRAGGRFSDRTFFPVPEETTQPSTTTILRTGGVYTIISNLPPTEED